MTFLGLFPDLGRRTLVMGVLNVTPDSFSDGGRTEAETIEHGRQMARAGADLIDVGGESTRPGAAPVSAEVEIARTIPVIEALAREGIGPISIDTTKALVARRALAAGAKIVNDISGGTFEPELLEVTRAAGAALVLMHTRDRPEHMQSGAWSYEGGVVSAVTRALEASRARAELCGIPRGSIALDPGIGFGKTLDENLELLGALDVIAALGSPVLVGTSRKSFLGKLTGRDAGERGYATAASVALAVAKGAAIVRVHDVPAMLDVCRVADAIVRRPPKC